MAGDYTRDEILRKVEAAGEDAAVFYKQDFVNYLGCAKDTGELYTEIVAEWCLANPSVFQRIPQITRKVSYKTVGHDGIPDNAHSNRTEELIAMAIFRQGELPPIGKVIDYQTPLKNERADRAGKIDLFAYDGSTLRILELKEPDSTETMLRCVLEGYTYLRTVDSEKLLRDFSLPADTQMKACPFVFWNSRQHREMEEQRPKLKQLMEQLDSRPFYITKQENGDYTVTES